MSIYRPSTLQRLFIHYLFTKHEAIYCGLSYWDKIFALMVSTRRRKNISGRKNQLVFRNMLLLKGRLLLFHTIFPIFSTLYFRQIFWQFCPQCSSGQKFNWIFEWFVSIERISRVPCIIMSYEVEKCLIQYLIARQWLHECGNHHKQQAPRFTELCDENASLLTQQPGYFLGYIYPVHIKIFE